jgi:hypothetical protein
VESKEKKLAEDKPIGEVKESKKAPEPFAEGNEKISILKHEIYKKAEENGELKPGGIEVLIKNVSDSEINTAVFEAIFYDAEGNVLDTVKQKTMEFRQNSTRKIRLPYSKAPPDRIESYSVQVSEVLSPPTPVVIEHEKIKILKHCIPGLEKVEVKNFPNCVEFSIKNVSDKTIATAIFEVIFYDIEGKELERTDKVVMDLKPNTCRAINVDCHIMEYKIVKSYSINTKRVVTADLEKVQVRRHERGSTEAGEEEITGTIKNISGEKTDAALVAQYYDLAQETIGTLVLPLRDIEPNETRQFRLKYKPQEGDKIAKYKLTVGEIV